MASVDRHKKIYQFDLNGKFIKKHDSLQEACQANEYDASSVDHAIFGRYRHAYGYIWLNEDNITELKERVLIANAPQKRGKTVLQIDPITKNVINIYNSVQEACSRNNFKSPNITGCCRNEQKTAYGYIWRYKKDE